MRLLHCLRAFNSSVQLSEQSPQGYLIPSNTDLFGFYHTKIIRGLGWRLNESELLLKLPEASHPSWAFGTTGPHPFLSLVCLLLTETHFCHQKAVRKSTTVTHTRKKRAGPNLLKLHINKTSFATKTHNTTTLAFYFLYLQLCTMYA